MYMEGTVMVVIVW